ncbi:MAG: biotin/lipoyl-binding protein [Rubrivivax sp.]|nr:biotin/lipoyl-binding protein [Rubrivivax sp.]
MRRYNMALGDREFVIDVQELTADRFQVVVEGTSYEVTLTGDENLPGATITPGYQPAPGAAASPALPRAPAAPAAAVRAAPRRAAAGSDVLNAPMPGVILELHVQAGDTVARGQQIAVLDAMKMHNFIGAPRAGVIAEVCVAAGQAVGHGDPIVRFAQG